MYRWPYTFGYINLCLLRRTITPIMFNNIYVNSYILSYWDCDYIISYFLLLIVTKYI